MKKQYNYMDTEFSKKLLKLQESLGIVTKDSKNPFYKSKYADINKFIEVVKPVLNECGVVVLQPLANIDGKPAIRTILIDSETGATLSEITPIPENLDPQKQGSAITYYRRYALQSTLLLQAEDDDGNMASGKANDIPF